MTEGWSSYALAARMRDTIAGIAEEAIRRLRPEVFIGEVYDFNFSTLTADIKLPGHTADELIQVRYSADRVPRSSVVMPIGIGADIVRVGGKPGNFYILDYVRGTPKHSLYETAVNPTGVILGYGAATPPPGYLMCFGDFVQQTVYPDLFSVIGHTYNRIADVATDHGNGTFRLPDYRARLMYGADPAVGALNTGWAVGSNDEDAVLSDRKLRFTHTHTHTIADQDLGQATNTPLGGTFNRLTSPALHNHGGNTGSKSALSRGDFHAWQSSFFIIKT